MQFLLLILKNVGRNPVRSTLTALGTMMLVFVVTLVWAILSFLDRAMMEKQANLKAVVTERWQIPSQMPFSYAATLTEGAAREPGDLRPLDSMTWQFFGGSIDPTMSDPDLRLFALALEPKKLRTMMDELDELSPERAAPLEAAIAKMERNRQGLIVGKTRLATIGRRVGDRITVYGLNYRDITLEFEIVGVFPDGRYDNSAAMNRDYLNAALDAYPLTHNNKPHPMLEKTLNLVWLRVPDTAAFAKIDEQIETSPYYRTPAVKCETASSGISTFLEAYRDLIWGMRWLLAPAVLVTLSLVISNAISISVRERRTELAVLKVLGFRPGQILWLVLGEALLVGTLSGLVSAGLTYTIVNAPQPFGFGGLKFPIAFFAAFLIPPDALWWGPAIGAGTAFLGSVMPAWSARSVRVADVFSKVA